MCCLFFFDIRILITPLVSPNFSIHRIKTFLFTSVESWSHSLLLFFLSESFPSVGNLSFPSVENLSFPSVENLSFPSVENLSFPQCRKPIIPQCRKPIISPVSKTYHSPVLKTYHSPVSKTSSVVCVFPCIYFKQKCTVTSKSYLTHHICVNGLVIVV